MKKTTNATPTAPSGLDTTTCTLGLDLGEAQHAYCILDAGAKILARGRVRNDRDAKQLARLGRADPSLLHPLKHRSEQTQRDQIWLKTRETLVKHRAGPMAESLLSADRSQTDGKALPQNHRHRPANAQSPQK